jgi:hypothetical protein
MPEVARFIDRMRDAFGREAVDLSLSRGLAGEPVFFAVEGGRHLGTSPGDDASVAAWPMNGVRDRYYCDGCDGSCVGTEQRCRR